MPSYVFVTGGVVSSVGKGIAAASLGMLLESRGLKVAMMKMDPYINVDPGTMNPYEHGEVFVTDDGAETDLDLGHYQRFTRAKLSRKSNVTTGSVYNTVIQKERRGEYLGKTVQVIPHITDEIKARIRMLTAEPEDDADIAIIEIGGTVGDIESQPFLEAIRQFNLEAKPAPCCFVHVTLLPYIDAAGELKTKPTQHSVRALRDIGIQPDLICCRTGKRTIGPDQRRKIAMFCNVTEDAIIGAQDISPIYAIPLSLHGQGMDQAVLNVLRIDAPPAALDEWRDLVERMKHPKDEVRIAAVGKYVAHEDAYKSINEAFSHAGVANDCKVRLEWIDSEQFENGISPEEVLEDFDGILIGPGFGKRGVEGKVRAVQYLREKKKPFLGICLGMQIACIEIARNLLGLKEANSTEFEPETPHPVISLLTEQKGVKDMGGTMRLGAYRCVLRSGTKAHEAYGMDMITERHRHRYEFNNVYREQFEQAGLTFSGVHPRKEHELVEIAELREHPWFCASQFHPEFKSTPLKAQPLFREFVRAALAEKKSRGK
ncbi:MAG TPA: CTP synthase [Candidatus Hydrogenedentes bacterium]|nr:CTP synthase [Candidatus Hydrogenedentota bacterium]HQM50082.1 CTP synthase [Candidatus Hydrogenedentota bacterium]